MDLSAGGPGSGMCVCALKLGKELGSVPAYKPYKLVKRIPSKTQHKERNPRHLYFQPGVLVPEKLKLCLRGRAYTSSLIKVYLLLNSACCTLEYSRAALFAGSGGCLLFIRACILAVLRRKL